MKTLMMGGEMVRLRQILVVMLVARLVVMGLQVTSL